MLETYRGVLRGDRIQWEQGAPEHLFPDRPVRVHITLLEPTVPAIAGTDQGPRLADALARLASLSSSSLPGDASEWQRQTREDRPLPGREE